MLLTKEERKKFIEYLQQEISSEKVILEQMEKMKLPEGLVRMNKTRLAAKTMVLRDLENIEDQIIEGG